MRCQGVKRSGKDGDRDVSLFMIFFLKTDNASVRRLV